MTCGTPTIMPCFSELYKFTSVVVVFTALLLILFLHVHKIMEAYTKYLWNTYL
jgi:hypothetical protein